MKKLELLEKRKKRLDAEAEKAEIQAKKYQEKAKSKLQESKKVELEIVAESLVQSGMTLSEFQELIDIKDNTKNISASEGEA